MNLRTLLSLPKRLDQKVDQLLGLPTNRRRYRPLSELLEQIRLPQYWRNRYPGVTTLLELVDHPNFRVEDLPKRGTLTSYSNLPKRGTLMRIGISFRIPLRLRTKTRNRSVYRSSTTPHRRAVKQPRYAKTVDPYQEDMARRAQQYRNQNNSDR